MCDLDLSTQKFLLNCQYGTDNLERATIAFILASTASKTCETAVFISSNATALCVRGAVDGLVAEGYEPLADLIAQYQGNGGQIWVCPVCVKAKGLTQDDLLPGIEVAGAPRTMAYLASGARLLA
ncbi:DsrE family protein [Halomonas maura]|uniref:DsrE family protein n=1 Tax=Halomonas maura TaxID=117606 RepID=UPI0025B3D462|nr:DsrE family protein [Halomonas maura]MDN3554841.1 DsrE family protein [Halomonas maura]